MSLATVAEVLRTMKMAAVDVSPRRVHSYVRGTHMPNPYLDEGLWRCHDCGQRLRLYHDTGRPRLRHRGYAVKAEI